MRRWTPWRWQKPGLREQKPGLREQNLGLREQNLGLREQNLGLREQNLGLREQNLGLRELKPVRPRQNSACGNSKKNCVVSPAVECPSVADAGAALIQARPLERRVLLHLFRDDAIRLPHQGLQLLQLSARGGRFQQRLSNIGRQGQAHGQRR